MVLGWVRSAGAFVGDVMAPFRAGKMSEALRSTRDGYSHRRGLRLRSASCVGYCDDSTKHDAIRGIRDLAECAQAEGNVKRRRGVSSAAYLSGFV